jgi:hypothetical protein
MENIYKRLPIDWDMTPVEAVTMYLEWGNNWRKGERHPVRSKDDVSYYFVIDTWQNPPKIILVKRNSENAEEIESLDIPEQFFHSLQQELGTKPGIYPLTSEIKEWLQKK